jgi:hypothetical protein
MARAIPKVRSILDRFAYSSPVRPVAATTPVSKRSTKIGKGHTLDRRVFSIGEGDLLRILLSTGAIETAPKPSPGQKQRHCIGGGLRDKYPACKQLQWWALQDSNL